MLLKRMIRLRLNHPTVILLDGDGYNGAETMAKPK